MSIPLRLVTGLALAVVLSGCEFSYPPCVANDYGKTITCRAAFSDGRTSDVTLLPGSVFWQGVEGRHLHSLAVISDGVVRKTYSEELLNKLRVRHAVKDEVWVLGAGGLRLEAYDRLRDLRKELLKRSKT